MYTYRIHGDNIVECERIAQIIIHTLMPDSLSYHLVSPSTVSLEISATFIGNRINCRLELLPGFNKNNKRRWNGNIFDALKEAGSYFDETPDAIVTAVENGEERILLGIEFCSALQAGNQAWQRSARAFSIGRTGCPYIYIVDFVKYELNNMTRARKNLRYPNAAVPYSYVNYANTTGNFVAQIYMKSEEFDKTQESSLTGFDESNFGNVELGLYMVKVMLGMDTTAEENMILEKNMNVVRFLASHLKSANNFTADEWQQIHTLSTEEDGENIIDYSVHRRRFGFHKTIAGKNHHGASRAVIELVSRIGIGLASKDLPFGIIPALNRPEFAESIACLYPLANPDVIRSIANDRKHLIIAIFKGFKPRGDDNRPDRGLLPFIAMLSSSSVDVMTYLYGQMIETNLQLLDSNPMELADRNGLWRSILALSNYIVLDVPVLARTQYDAVRVYDNTCIKNHFSGIGAQSLIEPKPAFSSIPINWGEDDVDTGIHYLFARVLGRHCFEGMCNPPGGDWSGFSVIYGDYESRWLSLPRVSKVISGKRPDHIIEMFGVFEKPLLLTIESKEKSADLESNVGTKLVTYIEKLMHFIPSATRRINPSIEDWQWGATAVPYDSFETVSAAAYIKTYAESPDSVFSKNCEILFVMNPIVNDDRVGWEIEIIPSTERSERIKSFIITQYTQTGDDQFIFS